MAEDVAALFESKPEDSERQINAANCAQSRCTLICNVCAQKNNNWTSSYRLMREEEGEEEGEQR
jgi:hypothetical protein